MKSVLLLLFAAVLLTAQEPAPKLELKITLEQQAEWLQARAELAEAKLAVKDAEAKISIIVSTLQGTCPLELNNGRLQCVVQPKTEPKK